MNHNEIDEVSTQHPSEPEGGASLSLSLNEEGALDFNLRLPEEGGQASVALFFMAGLADVVLKHIDLSELEVEILGNIRNQMMALVQARQIPGADRQPERHKLH